MAIRKTESRWLDFRLQPGVPGRSTSKFNVHNVITGTVLGYIAWYPSFRKYAFYPVPETVYDAECLEDIAAKLRELMESHKRTLRK